jgi:hypothetical protein
MYLISELQLSVLYFIIQSFRFFIFNVGYLVNVFEHCSSFRVVYERFIVPASADLDQHEVTTI